MHAAIWGETEVNWRHQAAALYRAFDVVAPLCCAVLVLGTWRLVSCSLLSCFLLLSKSLFIPHRKRIQASSLLHQQNAIEKCSNSLICELERERERGGGGYKKNPDLFFLVQRSVSSYSDLDYHYGQMFCTLLSFSSFWPCSCNDVFNFVLLLTIWYLRIRVSLIFDNMNNVAYGCMWRAWIHVCGKIDHVQIAKSGG